MSTVYPGLQVRKRLQIVSFKKQTCIPAFSVIQKKKKTTSLATLILSFIKKAN